MPALAKKCIDSWKRYCPDYEIIEWNESNFDVNCCAYVREAYAAKKWAFVSDYARYKVLYEHGGLYFDTDVELVKPIDDIVQRGAFMGIESVGTRICVAPGLGIGAPSGLAMYESFLAEYDLLHFKNEDGSLNLKTIVEYTTDHLYAHGLQSVDEIQCVEGIYIYPKEYFNPCDMTTGRIHITEQTRSIHHYAASWVDNYSRLRGKFFRFVSRYFGADVAAKLQKLLGRKK